MTADKFRTLALSLPETSESAHMDHPDFRVGGKIFATLSPDDDWGMLKLTPDEQAMYIRIERGVFEPFNGAWGRRGATKVILADAKESSVRSGLIAAWRNSAPKRLAQEFEGEL